MRTVRITVKIAVITLLAVAAIALAAAVFVRGGNAKKSASTPAAPVETVPAPADPRRLDPLVAELMAEARAAVVAAPDDDERWARLGFVYDANELPALAVACYDEAVALGSDDPRVLFHLGVVRARLGETAAAAEALGRVTVLAPGHAPAWWRLGLLRLDAGRLDDADAAFTRATQIDPVDSAGWLGLARVRLEQGDAEDAAEILEELLAWTTTNVGYAHQLLANAYRRLGRAEEAEASALRGQGAEAVWNDRWRVELGALRPGYAPKLKAANELILSGRNDEATALLEKLHELYPEKHTATVTLAGLYRAAGRMTESVRLLEDVIAADPENHRAHLSLAASFGRISQHPDIDDPAVWRRRAIDRARRAVELNPGLAEGFGMIGNLLVLDGRLDEAATQYLEAVRRDPTSTQWLFRAAVVLMRQERWEEAATQLEILVRRAPEDVDALKALGSATLALGRLDEAEASLRRAKTLAPDDPAIDAALDRVASRRAEDAAEADAPASDREPAP